MWIKWLIELFLDVVADIFANLFTNGKTLKDVIKWIKRKLK